MLGALLGCGGFLVGNPLEGVRRRVCFVPAGTFMPVICSVTLPRRTVTMRMGSCRRRNRFNIGETQVSVCAGNRCHRASVHRSGDLSAEVITPFRQQQNGIYIFFPAFKRGNGRQGAVYPVVGMPYGNGLIVFI